MSKYQVSDLVVVIESNEPENNFLVGHAGWIDEILPDGYSVTFDSDEEWADYSYLCQENEIKKLHE